MGVLEWGGDGGSGSSSTRAHTSLGDMMVVDSEISLTVIV